MIHCELQTERLEPIAFRSFGEVIEASGNPQSVNQGRGKRFDLTIGLRAADARAARPVTAIYRIDPSALPFEVRVIERHPLSTQLFYPNRAGRFLVCVFAARLDGEPDADNVHAFIGNSSQGVVYHAGTWHGPLVALDEPGEFLMQQWQCDGPLDCEERALAAPIRIVGRP
jgi:ureidoglycolate lyase